MAKTISIELQNVAALEVSVGSLFKGQPPVPPNLIPPDAMVATRWSADLDPGQYTFKCWVWGPAGTVGPVVVKDGGTVLANVPGHIDGTHGTYGYFTFVVPFTVA
jgi:hypothetical protein